MSAKYVIRGLDSLLARLHEAYNVLIHRSEPPVHQTTTGMNYSCQGLTICPPPKISIVNPVGVLNKVEVLSNRANILSLSHPAKFASLLMAL